MTDQLRPVPQRPDITYNWGARGSKGNRLTTQYGAPVRAPQAGFSSYTPPSATDEAEFASREQVDTLGKTNVGVGLQAPAQQTLLPADLTPPERKPGFFEGMLGGLVEAFTGVLGDPEEGPRNWLIRGAELVGEAADIPGEALGHIPVNQLFGLENTAEAFKMLPMTQDKQRVIDAMALMPGEKEWFMAQYLRTHAGDYAAAKGLPQILANLIRPDATIQERFFMGLGIPAQAVARLRAGGGLGIFGNRALDILNNPDLSDPALLELRDRYNRGEFGTPGSQQALDRLTDEIVTSGYGWHDDPFIGMLGEMFTDPVILASMGTGLALGAVRTGSLARHAANVARIARSSADNTVRGAVTRAEIAVERARAAGKGGIGDTTYEFAEQFKREMGGGYDAIGRQAMDELRTQTPGWKGQKDYYTVKMRPVIEGAAQVSAALNAPFGFFGKDGVGGMLQRKFAQDTSDAVFQAYDIGLVGTLYDDIASVGGNTDGLNSALGHAIAYTQKSLMMNNLIQTIRMRLGGGNYKALPDALSNPEAALDSMMKGENKMSVQGLEVFVRRTAKQYDPEVTGLEGTARTNSYNTQMTKFREDAARKLSRATGMSYDQALQVTRKAGQKELSFIDYVHWGHSIKEFVQVRDALQGKMRKGVISAIDTATLDPDIVKALEGLDDYDIVARATLVGERELTMQRARELLKMLDDAKDEAEKLRVVQQHLSTYEYLYQNLYEKTRITSDADLIARFETLIREGLENDRFVTVLEDSTLVDDLQPLGDFKARSGYEIGLAPARDKRWAPIYNGKNELVGYRPWMDVRVTPEDISAPTTFDVLKNRLFTPIRGENIMQESRRKFHGYLGKKYGLSRGASTALWDAIREGARERQITMRGFSPAEFRNIMNKVEGLSDWEKQQLGPRGLADAVAHAMEGDLAMVGLTTKATGIMKTRSYKYQNYIGQLAEKVYPLVRFNLNPLFQLQELIEPYFFNILRGVKVGWNFSEEQVGIHMLLDEFNMADRLADGFEAREFMMTGSLKAMQMSDQLAKVDFDGTVQTRKRVNYYNVVKRQFGDQFHDALEREMPGQWGRIQAAMNEIDKANGGSGNLSRGDIAERWFTGKGGMNPDNSWNSMHHYDGAVPDSMGRIRGISQSSLAKHFGKSDSGALRAAIMDPTDNTMTEGIFKENLVREGFTREYADRAYQVAIGPTVDEVLDSIEGDFADKGVVGFHRDLASALLDRAAVSHGISTDELVARKFTGAATWVDHNARLPLRAYTQLANRLGLEYELPPLDRADPRFEGFAKFVENMYPDDPDPKVVTGHKNAARRERDGKAPKVRNTQVQGPVNIAGLEIKPGKNHEEFAAWIEGSDLDAAAVQDIALWYEELAGMFGGMAIGMPDEMVAQLKPLLPDPNVDDLAARQEIGARLFMSWMSTQVQASPQAGLQAALMLMDEVANGRREIVHAKATGGAWKPHRYGVQANKYYAMLRDFDPTLPSSGFGVKLYDFSDSSRATTVRFYRRFAGEDDFMHVRPSDGKVVPLEPGAMDIWAMRERGYIDGPMLGYLAKRLAAKEGISEADAMVQVQIKTGFLAHPTRQVPDLDAKGRQKKNKKGELKTKTEKFSDEEYKAALRQFEIDHGLEEGSMKKEWGGTPTAAEYEHALKQYNDLADGLNAMNDGEGWNGRGYKNNPWTVREIQAIAWVQMRNEFEVGDYNIQHFNSAQLQVTYSPNPHMPMRDVLPLHRTTEHARDLVEVEMARDLANRLERLTGVTVSRIVPGTSGSSATGILDNTFYEVVGSPQQLRDAARVMSFLTHSDTVHGIKPSEKTSSGKGSVWAIDFVVDDGNPRVLDKLGRWLDEREDFQWNGYGTGTTNEGRFAVRSVFDPEESKRYPGAVKVPQSLKADAFEKRVPIGNVTDQMLRDGSWALEAGFDHPIPVEPKRQVYDNYTYTHDWADDAGRAKARIGNGEDADAVWREEMGRSIREELEANDRGAIAESLVTHDMAGFTAAGDAAFKRADPDAWAAGRGVESVVGPYRASKAAPEPGAGAVYSDTDGVPQQRGRNSRGQPVWNAATRWATDVDRAQRLVGGRLRDRRGELVFRRGRADVTSVAHELLHIFADDLEPSAVKNIHNAFFASPEGKAYLANGGTKPKGKHAHNRVILEAEEWMAYQFEEWLSTGIAPTTTLNAVFNDYANYYGTIRTFTGQNVDPVLDAQFQKMNPELHRGPNALYDVDEFRLMETARQALLRAEEEAFRVHYYRRGRTWFERSINHPYLGLYPASYMWGKVLPEMMRFLVRKPFGVEAPLAGMQMANHVFEAIQLEMNTDDGALADLVEQYPEAIRFLQLLVPGTPWDIPVNVPAWTRRLARDAWTGREPDFGAALTDTISYSFGPGRAPADIQDAVTDALGMVQSMGQMVTGEYKSPSEREAAEERDEQLRAYGLLPPEEERRPVLQPGRASMGGLPPTSQPLP